MVGIFIILEMKKAFIFKSTNIVKKYSNLFDKICTRENFYLAYDNAIKGKKHYKEVNRIDPYRYKYVRQLLQELKNKTYKVSEYKIFQKYTGGKWREIYKLPMRDRIVQHAIMRYLEPIFRENFIVDTYSSIKERGIHRAHQRLKEALRKYDYKYYLEVDIHKCYPSLDKNILKSKLRKKFDDKNLIWLLDTIIDSCPKGVPIGNYTSQYFNNFYFSELLHKLKEQYRVKALFVYCDNILILHNDKEFLHKLFDVIKIEIQKLNVSLNTNYQIYFIDDKSVDFVGYKTRKNYSLIRNRIKRNFIKKVTLMDFNNLTEKDINILGSYWGILVHGDCRHLWYKYTNVKKFKDLNIKVKERDFIKNLIDIEILIEDITFYYKKRDLWLKLAIKYIDENKIEHQALISTQGEILIEAAKQFKKQDFPIQTTIIINDKNYYQFT